MSDVVPVPELPPVTRHYKTPDDARWLQQERAAHPEVTAEMAGAAIDAVHRLELAGAL